MLLPFNYSEQTEVKTPIRFEIYPLPMQLLLWALISPITKVSSALVNYVGHVVILSGRMNENAAFDRPLEALCSGGRRHGQGFLKGGILGGFIY